MSGANALGRQVAALREAGAGVTVVIYDSSDRVVRPETLAQAQLVFAGARVCHFRPGPTDYFDQQHLSVLGAARLTRWYAAGDAGLPSRAPPMVQCWQR